MNVLGAHSVKVSRASYTRYVSCSISYSSPKRCVRVSVLTPDAPQQRSDSETNTPAVTGDEAKRRNDDALSRVLQDFVILKATGKLAVAEEEDEDEIDGDEGKDWVWWRADDAITSDDGSHPTTSNSRAPAFTAPHNQSLSPPRSLQSGTSIRRAPRAPLLKPQLTESRATDADAGGMLAASQFRFKASSLLPAPPNLSQQPGEP